MPNHLHGIIVVGAVGARVGTRHAVSQPALPMPPPAQSEQFGKPTVGTIPTIVRSFKSAVTKRINARRGTPGLPVWQRNYWEHIIRNEEACNAIAAYIINGYKS